MKSLTNIDLSRVVELSDNTDLSGELACAGGACEVDVVLLKSSEVETTNTDGDE